MRSKATLALIFSVAVLGAFLAIIAPAQNTPAFSPLQSHTWGGTQDFSGATLNLPSSAGLGNAPTFGTPVAGTGTSSLKCFSGGTAFSQCGLIFDSNTTDEFGMFHNLDSTSGEYFTLYDYIGGVDRWEAYQGSGARLHLQPTSGFLAIGPQASSTPQLLSVVGGNSLVADPSSLGSESLTNGNLTSGTSWTASGDCALAANAATCTFSAGTASTVQQSSGTLAVAGQRNRLYKFVYTISGVTGTPAASITSAFANTIGSSALAALTVTAGTKTTYFMSTNAPTNFVISTTLTTGQVFTIDTLSLKEVVNGNHFTGGTENALHFAGQDTPTVAAGGAIGTTPTITGSDFVGTVAVPSSAVTIGTIATVTFAHAYSVAPNCSVQQNGGTVPVGVGHGTPGTGSFTITAAIANVSATAYNFDFVCSGN